MPDFIFKKACHGYTGSSLVSCNIYSAAHSHLSAKHDVCRDTAHMHERKQNTSLKTNRRLKEQGGYQHKPQRGNLGV